MLNVGGSELLIIFLVALIFLGPERLPQIARQFGQTVASLRSLASGFQAEVAAAAQPARYDGPMHLTGPDESEAPDAQPEDAQSDLAQAARDVDVHGAEVPPVSSGGPADLVDEQLAAEEPVASEEEE